jgi:hypothetical protein
VSSLEKIKEVIAMEFIIDTEVIADYFYNKLIRQGYAPTEEEVEVLADIAFDYLLEIGMIEEEFGGSD